MAVRKQARKKSSSNLPPDHPIQAVVGSDSAKVTATAREKAALLTPEDGGDFALDTIDGTAELVDEAIQRVHEAIDSLNTVAFFGGGKLVWLKNVSFLADNQMGRSERVKEALEKLVDTLEEGLQDGVNFLLSATEIDKRKSFYKRLEKCARVEVLDSIDYSRAGEGALASVLEQRAEELGFRFSVDALELFLMMCSTESRQIDAELEKIRLFLGNGKDVAEIDDIRVLVAQTRAGVIWEIGNAFAARDMATTLRLIDEFLARGESAIGLLLAALVPTTRNLLHVKAFLEDNDFAAPSDPRQFASLVKRAAPSSSRHLPRKKDGTVNTYALGIAAVNCRNFTLAELETALQACGDANLELVTTQLDHSVILSKLVIKVMA